MAIAVEKALRCGAMACRSSSVDHVVESHSVMEVVSAVAHLEGSEMAAGIPSRCDAQAADPRTGCGCDYGYGDEEQEVGGGLARTDGEAAQGSHWAGGRMMAVVGRTHALAAVAVVVLTRSEEVEDPSRS